MPLPRKVVLPYEPIAAFEDSIVSHLSKILQSDDHTTVISSAKYVVMVGSEVDYQVLAYFVT